MDSSLHSQSQSLLVRLASQCYLKQGFSSMSPSVYDTAWLSMVQKPANSGIWLFPECFEFILKQQLPCGAWESYASEVDGILNTAAALLSVTNHLKWSPNPDWTQRSSIAQISLINMLERWDVMACDQVGFEILVVNILSLLNTEGFEFKLPHKLQSLHDDKLSKLPATSVYNTPSTLYHSLEALIGYIDFDQVKCWQESDGSMMGSPSSTAAYLMNTTTWDVDAEAYLKTVCESQGANGGVPCAWPTQIFEVSWVVTTFSQADIPIGEIEANAISTFLEDCLTVGNGTVGFSPSSLPDADDTAKTIMALRVLGRDFSVEPLIQAFEAVDHFKTYQGERNPSVSSNCNILLCLLSLQDPTQFSLQISKAVTFLCNQAFSVHVVEKWHLHELYWIMLLSQSYRLLYDRLQKGDLLDELFDVYVLNERIPMLLLQILIKTIQSQHLDGSWDGACEITAYAVLALSAISHVPCVLLLPHNENILAAIQRGKTFLNLHRSDWTDGHYLWVEKVTYASSILSEAYCLAAAAIPIKNSVRDQPKISWGLSSVEPLFHEMRRAGAILKATPLFSQVEPHILVIAELQACYALCALQRQRLDIFPRSSMGKDRYLTFIPLTWTACSSVLGGKQNMSLLCEMMTLSMLNYQIDEFMEVDVERRFGGDLCVVRLVIQELFAEFGLPSSEESFQTQSGQRVSTEHRNDLDSIRLTLSRYITYILHYPEVLSSPASLQHKLAFELKTFLLAHLKHAEDNRRFRRQLTSGTPTSSTRDFHATGNMGGIDQKKFSRCGDQKHSFYSWVRSTSADHTSCPFSFIFFNCLISNYRSNAFSTSRTAYVTEDLCRHLATLCRMYNDYGSVARDKDEGNLNSIDFSEFQHSPITEVSEKTEKELEHILKTELLWLAEYERRGLDMAFMQLEEDLGSTHGRLVDSLKLFIHVTDLYGQIYVQKDIATRVERDLE